METNRCCFLAADHGFIPLWGVLIRNLTNLYLNPSCIVSNVACFINIAEIFSR